MNINKEYNEDKKICLLDFEIPKKMTFFYDPGDNNVWLEYFDTNRDCYVEIWDKKHIVIHAAENDCYEDLRKFESKCKSLIDNEKTNYDPRYQSNRVLTTYTI